MPTSLPRSAREAWGEAVAEDVERWFGEALRERAVPRDEYREVLSRLDVVETRLNALEQGQTEQRRETLELRREMNARFDQVNERFDRMNEAMRRQTRWTVGAIVIIGAILAALLSIAEFAA